MKILIAEDDRISRLLMQRILEADGGHTLTTVNDGEEAWQQLLASPEPFDVCLLDIMMPRLDGYQTCSLIKHNKVFRSIPVIMLSSKDGLFDRARGRIVGSEHYLTKPFTKDELLGAIEAHIER